MAKIVATDHSGSPWEGGMPGVPLDCTIRAAVPTDIPAILALIASLNMTRDGASENGFLRQRHSVTDYERFAADGAITLAVLHDRIVGYVLSFPWSSPELQFERQVTGVVKWTGESYANPAHPVFHDAIYIGEVGIEPRLARRGIGRSLYADLLGAHPHANFIATTIEEPLLNGAAAKFHEALGFRRVGFFAVPEFFGLSPYRSGVYLRE